MAQHSNYWSCSNFADWLRGTNKPRSATSKGWREWNRAAKDAHPLRYWIVEEGLDLLQDFVTWPTRKIYEVKYYINNRWVTRTHALTAHTRDIQPGTWCDVGYRFLPCLFNELVDFVEIELAWWHIVWDDQAKTEFKAPFYARGWWRWRVWRSRAAGLANLEWQRNLKNDAEWMDKTDPDYGKPTPQAERAQEILELYKWWTVGRPLRRDPADASGWTEFCARRRREDGSHLWDLEDRSEEERAESGRILDELHRLEQQYEQEDTDMMIRLIKVRYALWT
jgi:hypothetical protein